MTASDAIKRNTEMSLSRRKLDWENQIKNSIDPKKSSEYRKKSEIGNNKECTMCGEFCAVKRLNELME